MDFNFYSLIAYLIGHFYKITGIVSKISGIENIPKKGSLIIASNHISYNDPPMIATSITNRQIYSMAKRELFKNKLFGFIISKLNAYPITREKADISSMRKTLDILRKGNALLLFPEGTRKKENQTAKLGIGFLVSKIENVAIIPCYIKKKLIFLFYQDMKLFLESRSSIII